MALPITLRKSTDCTYYLKGSCKKGDAECEFRHNPLALNPAVKDCAFWFNGRCTKGPACPFRHLAQNYGAYGMPRAPVADPSTVPCVFYAQGKCMKGDACPYSHSVTLAASAAGANIADETGVLEAEEGPLQFGQVPMEAGVDGVVDAGSRGNLIWRAQTQVVQEAAPGQESMVMDFDEEDEELDAAAPGSDRRGRSTPTKARRAPLWEVRTAVGRAGETSRSVAWPEPADRREERREGLGGRQEQGLGRRREQGLGHRQEDAGGHRRVVASTGPSIKDRLGRGTSQGSQIRVQAKADPQESQRERVVVDLQRGLLSKGADRWGRNRNQGEAVRAKTDSQKPIRAVETRAEVENGEQQPRKFGAEARRRWLELQQGKGPPDEAENPGRSASSEERSRLRDLVELGGAGGQVKERSGLENRAERREEKTEKEGPRILTLAEIRAAKKRSREAEEVEKAAAEEAAARDAKRQAPVRLNRSGVTGHRTENEGSADDVPERAEGERQSERAETEENVGNGVEDEDANGGKDEGAEMDPEAGEDDDAAQYGGENGSEYEDEGEEDGDDDIANLMKKYGDVVED